MLTTGTLLDNGNYRVERPLGSGGFGNTYLVTDLRMGMPCVVKEFFLKGVNVRCDKNVTVSVPSNKQTFDEQLQKFKKEAKRLFMLNNPHIVRVHSLFDENGTSYYVMDYIDGMSLSAILKQQGYPMNELQVRDILTQLLDALQAVHNQQEPLFHLDIKPGNIMLDRSGRAVLIDFGASKQMNADGGMTSTTTAMSYTPGYAPMEQIEQDIKSVGPWTDFYAIGATLYHMLTMNRPPSITSLNRPDAFAYPSAVSEEMKVLIKKLMALHPQDRPKNVDEIRNALVSKSIQNQLLEKDESTVITNPPDINTFDPHPDKPTNNKWWLWCLAILLALLLGGGGVWMLTKKDTPKYINTQTDDIEENDINNSSDDDISEQKEKRNDFKKQQKTSSDVLTDDELYSLLVRRINQWDRGHVLGEVYQLRSLYADRVHFYGEMCSRETVIEKNEEVMNKLGGFTQNSSNINMSRISDTSARCDFDKRTYNADGREGNYPSYLRFDYIDGDWLIVEESDAITDRNLRKRNAK